MLGTTVGSLVLNWPCFYLTGWPSSRCDTEEKQMRKTKGERRQGMGGLSQEQRHRKLRDAPAPASLCTSAHTARDRVAPYPLPGSPLPTLLGMVCVCNSDTALLTATDSSSWHQDLSRAHSGFSSRRVT